VTLAQAQAVSDQVFAGIEATHPEYDFSPTLSRLGDYVSGKLRRSMLLLWSAVGLVLLIVCVNLSSLLLARTTRRGKEFAMRTALGASRGRLLRQLLAESMVLVTVGASLGLGLAFALTTWLARQSSISLPLLHQVRVDGTALAWTLLLVVAITVLFGLLPGFRMAMGGADGQLQDALKDGGHGAIAGRHGQSLRSVLVIVEVALSCVLLVGAGLLLRSFLNTLAVDMGFNASQASVMRIIYEQGDGDKRAIALQEILRRVTALPGVQAVGVADMLPLGRNRSWQFWARDHAPRRGEIDAALTRVITPGYLNAMGMRLREGRDFTWQDGDKREHAVIINQAAARHFWPGEDALGKLSIVDGGDMAPARVVGVIQDVSQTSLEAQAAPEIYVPVMQSSPEGANLVVRTGGPGAPPPAEFSRLLLATLRSLNPAQPAYPLEPLQTTVERSMSPQRFFLVLVASFAVLGLTLAALGIYGVISYGVEQRTQEIGIRMALGASAGQVQRGILGQTALLIGIGIAAGTVTAYVVGHAIAAMLFGLAPTDPVTYVAMILLLTSAGLLAGFLPARRASRIDPMTALRGN
jgi:predicted permease